MVKLWKFFHQRTKIWLQKMSMIRHTALFIWYRHVIYPYSITPWQTSFNVKENEYKSIIIFQAIYYIGLNHTVLTLFLQTIDNIFYPNISYEQTDHENPVGVQSTLKIYVEVYEYFVEMTEDVFVKKISQGPEKYKYMTFNIMYICIYIFISIKS